MQHNSQAVQSNLYMPRDIHPSPWIKVNAAVLSTAAVHFVPLCVNVF